MEHSAINLLCIQIRWTRVKRYKHPAFIPQCEVLLDPGNSPLWVKRRRRRILVCNGLSGPHHVNVSFVDVRLFTPLEIFAVKTFSTSQHVVLPIKNLLPRSVGGDGYRDPEDAFEQGRPPSLQIQCTCRHR